mmetsp:Transcript_18267/g.59779  ORF Transcript_18267/g.59779 Transcript_18267/m.59779 type:complete len:221 (+) Transcript_18267:420-1082(+)|eukprot:scaffold18809_cov102-Isochrysis_galbana.AAC.2
MRGGTTAAFESVASAIPGPWPPSAAPVQKRQTPGAVTRRPPASAKVRSCARIGRSTWAASPASSLTRSKSSSRCFGAPAASRASTESGGAAKRRTEWEVAVGPWLRSATVALPTRHDRLRVTSRAASSRMAERAPASKRTTGGAAVTFAYERPSPKWKTGTPVKKRCDRPGVPSPGRMRMSAMPTRRVKSSECHVIVRRPDGLVTPNRASAMAAPPACPG